MRKVLSFTILALLSTGGIALAERRGGGPVRDHRSGGMYSAPSAVHGGFRGGHGGGNVVVARPGVQHQPVYARGGRFQFSGGFSIAAPRTVTTQRYHDHSIRPQAFVEPYQQVPGYTWVPGQWQWNGYEWTWIAGYYQPTAAYDGYSAPYGSY